MRDLPAALQAHLESAATTLCRAVRLTLKDGTVLGFTDHDAPLTHDGTLFEPSDGMEASEQSGTLGPAPGEWDLSAALTDDRLQASDLARGAFDGASVELFLVNWAEPSSGHPLSVGKLGEVQARDGLFHAEVRGPFAAYDTVRGRVFSARCDAELGDARCTVDLTDPDHRGSGVITEIIAPNWISVDVFAHFADGHFNEGLLSTDGSKPIRVRRHTAEDGHARLELWHAPAAPFVLGQSVTVTVGCDKRFATCRDRFSNAVNFRGFPAMPGDDFALSYPSQADGDLDGGSRTQGDQ
ncbi:MAG: DUF2163 domain-containing protein [Devosiaceae bacterium]|nr:DUF2163 domain-containing protein [Devosiaceae bacterium MH13]